jgi:hypothetical protein
MSARRSIGRLYPAATGSRLRSCPPKQVLDWERRVGPAPWRPYNSAYVRGDWRNFYDFHGGGILEWGSHTVDLCQWAAGFDEIQPVE